jgi:hypothetical protein
MNVAQGEVIGFSTYGKVPSSPSGVCPPLFLDKWQQCADS